MIRLKFKYSLNMIICCCFIFCGLVFAEAPEQEKKEKITQEKEKKNPKLKAEEKKKSKAEKSDVSKKQETEEVDKKEMMEVPETLGDPFEEYFPKPEESESLVVVPNQFLGPLGSAVNVQEEKIFDASSFVVTGIVWGADKPKAIINGNIYGKGDKVDEAEIVNITKEGILFKYYDQEYLLKRGMVSAESSDKGGA